MSVLSLLLRVPAGVVGFVASLELVGYALTALVFLSGLLAGLTAAYLVLIYPLPLTVKEAEQRAAPTEGLDEKALRRFFVHLPPWVSNPDYERVDWLNRIVAEMWPCINKAVSEAVQRDFTPLLNNYKPAFLHSLSFSHFSLGSLPPAIIAIKSLDTHDDEVIIQPVMRWAANNNIAVTATLHGFSCSLQLTDLHVRAVVRITVKPLVPVFPCFSRITLALMDKPHVDFALRLLGLDVMAIPGLCNLAQNLISDTIADLYLWPKTIELYHEEPKVAVGWLTISALRASNLRNLGLVGTSDPYVHCCLSSSLGSRVTSVRDNELNPDWGEEELRLKVLDPATQKLHIEVFDKNTAKADRLMGVQTVALGELTAGEAREFDLRLAARFSDLSAVGGGRSRRDLGSICFRLLYTPLAEDEEAPPMDVEEMQEEEAEAFPEWVPVGGGLLRVILHRGEGLEARHHANPFVVLRFRNQEWQSQHYKKQADVVFEEEPFEVFLEKPPVRDTLHIKVFSKSLSSFSVLSKEAVGYCEIALSDVVINGRINDLYPLIDSKGQLQLEMQWHRRTDNSQVAEETSLATRVGQMIQQTAVGNMISQTVTAMETASEEIKARWQQPI
ncbi:hypothetical protein CLOM_g19297 [Closterium sp. NIES-68]|nr:hypothetical protein CLOM_g19297 [Closterium sp. NIES-68]GJP58919.1 hypothetical protein CLOP_g6690 [Closterium sp. NIES-67]